jgi:hypothetical protein
MTRPLRDSPGPLAAQLATAGLVEDLDQPDDQAKDFGDNDIDETSGLDELLVWAVQSSVSSVGEAQLMATSYLQDRKPEAGLSEADRRRRGRVRRKLIDAVWNRPRRTSRMSLEAAERGMVASNCSATKSDSDPIQDAQLRPGRPTHFRRVRGPSHGPRTWPSPPYVNRTLQLGRR